MISLTYYFFQEDIFTKEESAKLEISLAVSEEELKLILQTLTFIFQQVHITFAFCYVIRV